MKEEQRYALDLPARDRCEGADLLDVRRVQLRQCPLPHFEMPFGDRLRRVGGHLEQKRVRVAEHRLAAERGEPVEGLRGLRAALRDVAEADDLVDPDALDIFQHNAEGDVVRVLVGDEREAHAARLPA